MSLLQDASPQLCSRLYPPFSILIMSIKGCLFNKAWQLGWYYEKKSVRGMVSLICNVLNHWTNFWLLKICVQEYNFVSVNSVRLNYWFTCLWFRIPTLRDNLVNDLFHANNRLFTESEFFYCLMARQSKEAQFPHRVFFPSHQLFFFQLTL